MYTISELTIAFASIIILCNTVMSIADIRKQLPYIKHYLKTNYLKVKSFFTSYDDKKSKEETKEIEVKIESKKEQKIESFENKYIEKFKKFPNEFSFNDSDFLNEIEEKKLIIENNKNMQNEIEDINKEMLVIKNIFDNITDNDVKQHYVNENKRICDLLCEYYKESGNELDEDEIEALIYSKEIPKLIERVNSLKLKTSKLKSQILYGDDIDNKAHENMINRKLDKFKNNYVLEMTPLGNIYMRYNNEKKSFQYFSDKNIPYRYLETVGRKYVMTYWCKPIFVDIDEELKRAESKQDEIKNAISKSISISKANAKKGEMMNARPMKNRNVNDAVSVVPSKLKVGINENAEKTDYEHLIKENANRYTWEGRFSGFSPLIKIERQATNKNTSISYKQFKEMKNLSK